LQVDQSALSTIRGPEQVQSSTIRGPRTSAIGGQPFRTSTINTCKTSEYICRRLDASRHVHLTTLIGTRHLQYMLGGMLSSICQACVRFSHPIMEGYTLQVQGLVPDIRQHGWMVKRPLIPSCRVPAQNTDGNVSQFTDFLQVKRSGISPQRSTILISGRLAKSRSVPTNLRRKLPAWAL